MSTRHCPTCSCYDACSAAMLNLRMAVLVSEAVEERLEISDKLRQHLVESERFRFGFTGWKTTARSLAVCGQFLLAICSTDGTTKKYGYVNTLNPAYMAEDGPCRPPLVPSAHEYVPGDSFDIHNSPDLTSFLVWLGVVGDADLRLYIHAHLKPLIGLGERLVAEISGS